MTFLELWREIPAYLRPELARYLARGVRPGDFMAAVLNNDLRRAYRVGTRASLNGIQPLLLWFERFGPEAAFGAPQAVDQWCQYRRGMPTGPFLPDEHVDFQDLITVCADNELDVSGA